MKNKTINFGEGVQEKVISGVDKAVTAIVRTLGPAGKNVAFDDGTGNGVTITRDGATVAKNIKFRDQEENFGAELVRKAAALTEEQSGDSTSTCSLLIGEFCKKGQRAVSNGANVNEINRGMIKAGKWVTSYIKSSRIPVDGDLEKVRKVATISANNDPEVGDIVVEGMKKVGMDGLITVEMSNSLDTVIEVTTGMRLEKGWSSPQFVTNPSEGKCVMEDPYILVADERISSVAQMVPLLTEYQKSSQGKPLLIVCDEIDDAVSAMFIFNNFQGALRCCIVKGVDFGDTRKNIMEDLATVVGATHLCSETGRTVSSATMNDLGSAKKVVISRDATIIYEGSGDPEATKERADVIRARMTGADIVSEFDKNKFSKRLANLTGGIAVIKAGGASEAETMNRKATIEDAVLASKSAIEEGCAPGGGYVYYKASEAIAADTEFWNSLGSEDAKEGAMIVVRSLPAVLRTVAENSGVSGDVVLNEMSKSTKDNYGFNAKTKVFEDLINSGVLDSSKSIRVALENSISAASMILLIDCTIIEDEVTRKIKDYE